jgi:hypothetical protein
MCVRKRELLDREGSHPRARRNRAIQSFLPLQNSCRSAADMIMTYLELVGPLRLRSDERNGESESDDETVGEIHVTIKCCW